MPLSIKEEETGVAALAAPSESSQPKRRGPKLAPKPVSTTPSISLNEDENVDELSEDIVDEKLVNDDLVKQISNMAIDKLLTNYEDMSNNIVVNTPTLNETTTEMYDLNKKIDKVTTETSMKEKNDLMYNKINELNTKMNELTALIQ